MRILLCVLVMTAVTSPLSARTWRVEKDGSGDFTVIQDALDACAEGDSVRVGPGRFDDFRLHSFPPSGSQAMVIMAVNTSGLTIVGSGPESTTIGPQTHVDEVNGLNPACLVIELGAETDLSGFTFENVRFPLNIRHQSQIAGCRINNAGESYALTILEGELVEIRDCEFFGPRGIITASAAVTRPQIVDCRFENPALDGTAIVIGNGGSDAFIARCTFMGYASGVETSLGGTATIEDCHFTQQRLNIVDLSSGFITMRRCLIDPGARFPLRVNIGRLECYDTIIGGGTTATLLTAGDVFMRGCHVLNGGALTVDFRGPSTSTVDLRLNWWGTTDLEQIESWIDERFPVTFFEPILQGPVPNEVRSIGELKSLFSGRN